MIHNIRFRVFVKATEDPEKVKQAVKNVLGDVKFREEEVKGVLGNRILILSGEIKGSAARDAWTRLREMLGSQLDEVRKNLDLYVDPFGTLHLRLSKQEAYLGKAVLGGRGVIKVEIKLKAYPAKWENFIKAAREILS